MSENTRVVIAVVCFAILMIFMISSGSDTRDCASIYCY